MQVEAENSFAKMDFVKGSCLLWLKMRGKRAYECAKGYLKILALVGCKKYVKMKNEKKYV